MQILKPIGWKFSHRVLLFTRPRPAQQYSLTPASNRLLASATAIASADTLASEAVTTFAPEVVETKEAHATDSTKPVGLRVWLNVDGDRNKRLGATLFRLRDLGTAHLFMKKDEGLARDFTWLAQSAIKIMEKEREGKSVLMSLHNIVSPRPNQKLPAGSRDHPYLEGRLVELDTKVSLPENLQVLTVSGKTDDSKLATAIIKNYQQKQLGVSLHAVGEASLVVALSAIATARYYILRGSKSTGSPINAYVLPSVRVQELSPGDGQEQRRRRALTVNVLDVLFMSNMSPQIDIEKEQESS